VLAGKDPMIARSSKTWGYQTNYGAFGQFTIVQDHQCLPKAPSLTWEEAAASTLCGTTAYRMMFGWQPHVTKKDDVVLVWGGSGGVGSMAIQLAKAVGAIPVAVVSDDERGEFCMQLGAKGYINRKDFTHWGTPPHWTDDAGQKTWTASARAFGAKIWEIVGEKKDPAIVIEHPGEATVPTSIFVCEPGGMVVICAGTSGYSAVVDLRYHWTRQKRFQGSHGTNDQQALEYNKMLTSGAIHPALGEVLAFDQIPEAHQRMHEGDLALGNTAILIGAPRRGLGKK